MAKEKKRTTEEPKPVFPEFEGKKGSEAFGEFYGLHITTKGEPTPSIERQQRLVEEGRRVVGETLDDVVNGRVNLGHLGDDTKKRAESARIVTRLVHKGYRDYLNLPAKPQSEKDVENYLRIAGVNVDYNQLLNEIASSPNLKNIEQLPRDSAYRQLIEHIARARDDDALKVEKLQKYMVTTPKIHEDVKKEAGERMDLEFEPGSNIQDVFERFSGHLQTKQMHYEATLPSEVVKPATPRSQEDKYKRRKAA